MTQEINRSAITFQNMNWDCIIEWVRCYNEKHSDDLLYRIGMHVGILTLNDQSLIDNEQGGLLNTEQRNRVLGWLISLRTFLVLKPEHTRAGTTRIMSHSERQAFLKNSDMSKILGWDETLEDNCNA